jgi:hypothetical protein
VLYLSPVNDSQVCSRATSGRSIHISFRVWSRQSSYCSFASSHLFFSKRYVIYLACTLIYLVLIEFLQQTVPKKTRRAASEDTLVFKPNEEPLPLKKLLVFPVIISVANYVALAFLNICLNSLIPLFFAMPLEIGGLGFEPATIGYVTGFYGAGVGIFQAFFFAKFVRRFGEKRLFVTGMCMYLPMFALFPIISYLAQQYGVTRIVWVCISMMLPPLVCMDMAYGTSKFSVRMIMV